jgi:hypothetical protein
MHLISHFRVLYGFLCIRTFIGLLQQASILVSPSHINIMYDMCILHYLQVIVSRMPCQPESINMNSVDESSHKFSFPQCMHQLNEWKKRPPWSDTKYPCLVLSSTYRWAIVIWDKSNPATMLQYFDNASIKMFLCNITKYWYVSNIQLNVGGMTCAWYINLCQLQQVYEAILTKSRQKCRICN